MTGKQDELSFSRRKTTEQWMDVLEDVRKEYEKETEKLKKTIAELLDMVVSLKNRNCELDEIFIRYLQSRRCFAL